jgi:hypothetical protein
VNQSADALDGKSRDSGRRRATENKRRAVGTVVSSRVRTEIKHATNCSNADEYPSSANWNMAAFGNRSIAFPIVRKARSI